MPPHHRVRPQTLAWLRDPLRLTVLYSLSIFVIGLPVVWTFDPEGSGGAFAGLVLAAFALLLPTGVILLLPRRWGMSIFALEAILIWVANMWAFAPTRVFSGFILWSILELPMYGFEILGLLDPPAAAPPPHREAGTPTLLAVWLLFLAGAYAISIYYEHAGRGQHHSSLLWVLAVLYLPLPPLLALRGVVHRGWRPRRPSARLSSAAG